MTILISSHILSELELVVDRYIILHKGKIIQNITKASIQRYLSSKIILEVDNIDDCYRLLNKNNYSCRIVSNRIEINSSTDSINNIVQGIIEENQRKYVIASSNFTYLVESSIDGLYDISANKKEESFKKEFIEKIKSLLTVKLEAAELSNCIFTSISIYIIGLATCILIFSNLYRFETSYVDNSNIILLISLLTTILQPILTTWLSYSRSRFSLEYISMKDKGNFISSKDIYSLGITEIESIKIEGLSMQYLDKTIFNDININLEKGSLYVITGDNGSGKSTFLKILQGFITPTKGKIIINNSEYKTLKDTNICDYIGIYSNEFRLFAGSIDKNINFDLFNISSGINYKENKFIGLPLSYQIDSQGKKVSLGQKQRTLILRSLSDDSKDIFLLDEPTSNLDKSSKQQLKEMIVRLLKKKKIICIVTHDEEFIELATNIIHLKK